MEEIYMSYTTDPMSPQYWEQEENERRASANAQEIAHRRHEEALRDPANQKKIRLEGEIIEMAILPAWIDEWGNASVFIPYSRLPAKMLPSDVELKSGSLLLTLIFHEKDGVWEPKYPDKVRESIDLAARGERRKIENARRFAERSVDIYSEYKNFCFHLEHPDSYSHHRSIVAHTT